MVCFGLDQGTGGNWGEKLVVLPLTYTSNISQCTVCTPHMAALGASIGTAVNFACGMISQSTLGLFHNINDAPYACWTSYLVIGY